MTREAEKSVEEKETKNGSTNIVVRVDRERKDAMFKLAKKLNFRDNSAFFQALMKMLEGKTPEQISQILNDHGFGGETPVVDAGAMTLRLLAEVPCGPWLPALAMADEFHMSGSVAEELEARDSDVLVRATGQSMKGACIPDTALVLMRPLTNGRQPKPGEIALVQIQDENEQYLGTMKHWHPQSGGNVVLKNGDGEIFPLPENIRSIEAVATFRGCIWQRH